MNCPKCNSSYVEEKYSLPSIEATEYTCVCCNCKHKFTHKVARELPQGELVLEIRGSSRDNQVNFYRLPDGAITVLQMMYDTDARVYKVVALRAMPQFKVSQFLSSFGIQYDSYSLLNRNSGTLFKVSTIVLHGAWLEMAKSCEAMTIMTRSEDSAHSKNQAVVADAVAWLNDRMLSSVPTAASTGTGEQKQGCYVATCVYGSYDCPEVWTLRRYRDGVLGRTWYGRKFIRLYYAISPTAVRLFGKTRWFHKLFRRRLDRMVKRLNGKGFDNTPYQDKKW